MLDYWGQKIKIKAEVHIAYIAPVQAFQQDPHSNDGEKVTNRAMVGLFYFLPPLRQITRWSDDNRYRLSTILPVPYGIRSPDEGAIPARGSTGNSFVWPPALWIAHKKVAPMKITVKQAVVDPRTIAAFGKGHSRYVHPIVEKLLMNSRSGLSKNECIILNAVIRWTAGMGGRPSAKLSTSYLHLKTHLHPRRIREARKSLIRRNILIEIKEHQRWPPRPKELAVNYCWQEWILGRLSGDKNVQRTKTVHSKGTNRVDAKGTNHRTIKERDRKKPFVNIATPHKDSDFLGSIEDNDVPLSHRTRREA